MYVLFLTPFYIQLVVVFCCFAACRYCDGCWCQCSKCPFPSPCSVTCDEVSKRNLCLVGAMLTKFLRLIIMGQHFQFSFLVFHVYSVLCRHDQYFNGGYIISAGQAEGVSCSVSTWHALYILWSSFYQNRKAERG